MSYILDALKKSESERGHGAIPGVQTVHSSSINYQQQKKTIWPYFLIAAITLNILVVAYFIYTQNNPTPSAPITQKHSTSTPVLSTRDRVNPVPAPVTKTPVNITPVKATPTKLTPTTPAASTLQITEITPTPSVEENSLDTSTLTHEQAPKETYSPPLIEASAEPAQIIEQYELPENIQRELPTLTISAHVYSSNPSQRSLIVNNEFFEEGDYIMDNIILHEITSDGAIFDYKGLLFRNRSVSGWQ